jgi:hypothetical protein
MTLAQFDSFMLIKDAVIAVAACTGMGLGFYNLWREHRKEKVKLTIVPKSVVQQGINTHGHEFIYASENEFKQLSELFAIEVINLSQFSVVIDEVGFFIKGTKCRMSVPNPIIMDQESWPRKLEPRQSVTVYCSLKHLLSLPNTQKIWAAFAKTSCKHIGRGQTKALKQLVQFANKSTPTAS